MCVLLGVRWAREGSHHSDLKVQLILNTLCLLSSIESYIIYYIGGSGGIEACEERTAAWSGSTAS